MFFVNPAATAVHNIMSHSTSNQHKKNSDSYMYESLYVRSIRISKVTCANFKHVRLFKF